MRALVTGATGFLGGALARLLVRRGWQVDALVRASSRTGALERAGVRLVRGDVTDPASVRSAVREKDAVFHAAAWYELGVDDLARMRAVNVDGTRHVLSAAAEAGVPRIVHTSSVAALGSTGGRLVDESHARGSGFGSAYERTKAEAHEVARRLARAGAPVLSVLPGTIFGPGDRSLVARLLRAHLDGWLVARAFPELAMSLVWIDDCAAGLALCAERGVPGGEYILVGEVIRLGDWIERMADVTGRSAPRLTLSPLALRAGAGLFPLVAGALGLPRGLGRDGIRMALGASWMFSSERARRELGWTVVDFDVALARTLCAFDRHGGLRFRPRTERARRALAAARATAPREDRQHGGSP